MGPPLREHPPNLVGPSSNRSLRPEEERADGQEDVAVWFCAGAGDRLWRRRRRDHHLYNLGGTDNGRDDNYFLGRYDDSSRG